jgi:hypothetical protein
MLVFTSLTCLGLNKSGVIRVPTRDPSLDGLFVKGRVQIPWSDTNIARNYLLHMGILMKKLSRGDLGDFPGHVWFPEHKSELFLAVLFFRFFRGPRSNMACPHQPSGFVV